MSSIIQFKNISKNFKISTRKKGVNAFVGFFKREKKIIEALKDASF